MKKKNENCILRVVCSVSEVINEVDEWDLEVIGWLV